MGKHVGELWRKLNQTEKYPFDEKARLDRWRHREEKVAYMVSYIPMLRRGTSPLTYCARSVEEEEGDCIGGRSSGGRRGGGGGVGHFLSTLSQ